MAQVTAVYLTGKSLYFMVTSITGQYWNGSAFENYNASNLATYQIGMTEDVGIGVYRGTFPAGITAGTYDIIVKDALTGTGTSIEISDLSVGIGVFAWDGTTLRVDTNVSSLANNNQSLLDLKDFVGTGYDPSTHKVQGVVLVDTSTENTDMITGTGIDETLTASHGAGAWTAGSAGSGANAVTITVDDGSTALESAKVRFTKGVLSLIQNTNASGVATFSLDNGTWTVTITLPGYIFTPTTIDISTTTAQTYSMTEVSFPSSNPDLVTGFLYTYDEDGIVESGVTVNMRFVDLAGTGIVYDQKIRTETSDANGLVNFTNLFPGARYEIRRETNGIWTIVTVASDASDPVALPSFWGKDE